MGEALIFRTSFGLQAQSTTGGERDLSRQKFRKGVQKWGAHLGTLGCTFGDAGVHIFPILLGILTVKLIKLINPRPPDFSGGDALC